ncbi:hypothetical protein ACFOEZ_20120 [Tianweitania populi]|uniref:Uncharacterized protein n=1 Tax=Tianweitania populi TaxID=1607949 RepID=A0A8J3DUE0_9HYPH|nr:hypothetical protein [Tianweitania populi]GHD21148.1 hypothetical protein GCM10016234_34510 [Tianweitania populi]
MNDETEDLTESLAFTLSVILNGNEAERQHLANAYRSGRRLIAGIPFDRSDARPRIIACLERFNTCDLAGEIASAGWMLAAIEERVAEKNVRGWRKLRKLVDEAVRFLPLCQPTVH